MNRGENQVLGMENKYKLRQDIRCIGLDNLRTDIDDAYTSFQFDWLDGKEECLIYFQNNMDLVRKNDPNIFEDCIFILRKNKINRLLKKNI